MCLGCIGGWVSMNLVQAARYADLSGPYAHPARNVFAQLLPLVTECHLVAG
jgi:hypothetical protein